MRLICPNCDAQYDIASDAIPEGGRDVQCSSCSHTWFQTEKPVRAGRARSELLLQRPVDEDDTPALEQPTRKPLDSSISEILRAELAHDREARPSTTSSAPPQTQAASAPPNVTADETRRRISRLTIQDGSTPAAVAAAATGAVASDPNLRTVPGIDEINASLRARAEASDMSGLTETEQQEAVKRSGFRRGFFFVLILIAILITPYFFQQQINENLPQFSQYMTPYVETVDQLRLWLNAQAQTIGAMIEGFTSGDSAAPDAES